MFCEQICWIVVAQYFAQFQRFVSESLLNPKALGIYVAQFAQALPATYTHGGRAAGPHSDLALNA